MTTFPINIELSIDALAEVTILPKGKGFEFSTELTDRPGVYVFRCWNLLPNGRRRLCRWYVGQGGNIRARCADYTAEAKKDTPDTKTTEGHVAQHVRLHLAAGGSATLTPIVEVQTDLPETARGYPDADELHSVYRRLMVEAAVIAAIAESPEAQAEWAITLNRSRNRKPRPDAFDFELFPSEPDD